MKKKQIKVVLHFQKIQKKKNQIEKVDIKIKVVKKL